MSRDHSIRPAAAFFGRRKGKTLRASQASNLHQVFPQYRLDIENPPPADLRELFNVEISTIRMEIGFGGGEHLLHEADRCPRTGFIGIEPFVNGMAKCVSALASAPRPNVRLFDDDAVRLLDWLAPASVDQVDLLYPDPWPKKRHWKRRFVSPPNLDRLVRVLRTGGKFCFASDIDTYVNWTLLHCRDHPGLAWQARTAADWRDPYDNWSGTRYEAKALREGRTAAYLTFQRR